MSLISPIPLIVLLVSRYVFSTELDVLFKNFQHTHHKTYKTSEEIELRKNIFNSNLLKIQEHNRRYEQGLETYTMGVNQFTDMTEEEFSDWLNGNLLQWPQVGALKSSGNILLGEIPDRIDWREKGVVTEVKNQGSCGSCWAFSTTGSLEAQLALQTGQLISLSEQELVDCSYSTYGCNGGVVQYAYNYVISKGLSSAEDYPYNASEGSCESNSHKVVTMEDYYSITPYNEMELKLAVGLIGPVSVSIHATPLKNYLNGTFTGSCSGDINHAVLAVGYDKDIATGEEYWIIKNSWGALWGESGYFKLSLGKGLCLIAAQACFPLEVNTYTPRTTIRTNGSSNHISRKFIINVIVIFAILLKLLI